MNINSPQNNISNIQMEPTNTQKRKGVSIYDFKKDRMVYYKNPYGAKAKKAYKKYINAGYEPWMV
eukprot:SAG11_NODE_39701_length_224_cov_10.880000_1_plen_64_part_10